MPAQNIFVVDDDEMLVECVTQILQEAGHSVESVTDSRDALSTLSAHPGRYDVLISDNNMPHLSGRELIGTVRKAGFDGKIVMYSGSVSLDDEVAFKAIGTDVVLRKPFDLKLLIPTIEDLCGKNGAVRVGG